MKRLIIRLSIKTLHRIPFSISILCLFSQVLSMVTANNINSLHLQNADPFIITIVAEDTVDISELQKITGVKTVTPVINSICTIELAGTSLELSINGVLSSYFNGVTVYGNIFPTTSNMPYVVLNVSAVNAIANKTEQSDVYSDLIAACSIIFNESTSAEVCGIIEDSNPDPQIYLNYNTASTFISDNSPLKIWITLENLYDYSSVTSDLKLLGYDPSFDNTRVELWDSLMENTLLSSFSCLGFIICFIMLSKNNYILEHNLLCNEITMLRLSGLGSIELINLYVLRIAIFSFLCFIGANMLVWYYNLSNLITVLMPFVVQACTIWLLYVLLITKKQFNSID